MVPLAKRRRYMLAAATIRTHSIREAAILGAITDSAVNYGRLDVEFVRYRMVGLLHQLVNVDRRLPEKVEIAMVLTQFERELGHRFMS